MTLLEDLFISNNLDNIILAEMLLREEILKRNKDILIIDFFKSGVGQILFKDKFNILLTDIAKDINYDLDLLEEYLNNLPSKQ